MTKNQQKSENYWCAWCNKTYEIEIQESKEILYEKKSKNCPKCHGILFKIKKNPKNGESHEKTLDNLKNPSNNDFNTSNLNENVNNGEN